MLNSAFPHTNTMESLMNVNLEEQTNLTKPVLIPHQYLNIHTFSAMNTTQNTEYNSTLQFKGTQVNKLIRISTANYRRRTASIH